MQANHPILRLRKFMNTVKERVYKLKNKPSGIIRVKEPFIVFLIYYFLGKRTFAPFDSMDDKERLKQKIELLERNLGTIYLIKFSEVKLHNKSK